MFSYIAYGLQICSEIRLPELLPITPSHSPDVYIRRGPLTPPPLEPTESNCFCHVTAQSAYLAWEEAVTLWIRNGKEIIFDLQPGSQEQVVRLFLLGAGLGMLLYQRGIMTLHASTVVVQEQALVFMGDRGMGKSTIAGALMAQGYSLIADDVTALDMTTPTYRVIPGYPQLKLWADAATTLGHSPTELPQIHPDFDKHAYRCSQEFCLTPAPLKAIYLLGFGSSLTIAPLSMASALALVMRHWYCARFGSQMLNLVGNAALFQWGADLVRHVPIWRLQRPEDLSQLEQVVHAVEAHVQQDLASRHPMPL